MQLALRGSSGSALLVLDGCPGVSAPRRRPSSSPSGIGPPSLSIAAREIKPCSRRLQKVAARISGPELPCRRWPRHGTSASPESCTILSAKRNMRGPGAGIESTCSTAADLACKRAGAILSAPLQNQRVLAVRGARFKRRQEYRPSLTLSGLRAPLENRSRCSGSGGPEPSTSEAGLRTGT